MHAAKVGIYSPRQSFLPDSERNAYSLIFDICSLFSIRSPEAVLRFFDSIMPDTITIPSENISRKYRPEKFSTTKRSLESF
ncbi:hypothetical protein HMPREF1555_01513 [Porphyromonas gingivalis F0570]|uniref:Uncharacterized protein n=1 Tax=Porphyromonas gingivalis F0570 TaxID=1227271 RepID=A0A0E2M4K4_PORGN|nr:hypothetical protein HMPREF1555_01513 [Porphyromonas gingivalis F0570]